VASPESLKARHKARAAASGQSRVTSTAAVAGCGPADVPTVLVSDQSGVSEFWVREQDVIITASD